MENWKEKSEGLATFCLEGEVTMTKITLWLVMLVCLWTGIAYGRRKEKKERAKEEKRRR